jgi:hypothetical protein
VRAEQLVPLSAKAAATIRAQQDHIRQHWPCGSPWLFPGMARNSDGRKPYSHRTFCQQLEHWQRVIGLHDQAGQPVTVTAHQFRHTLGTRLINSGVPQHVVQKLLGHASPHMTAHYARVHDTTIREAFDTYQQQRVNACLTCPDFQTTPQFLDIHRRQAATNLRLITRAEASGQTRLAASLRQVQANLEKIIPALESLPADPEETGHEPG